MVGDEECSADSDRDDPDAGGEPSQTRASVEPERRYRRTWPQRLVIVGCVGVIVAALVSSITVNTLYKDVSEIGRVDFPGDLLFTDNDLSEPVNILVIGTDSALGIDEDDPIHIGRKYDPRGTHNADSISLVRLDPVSGQVWVMSIPRDLYVPVPRAADWKIASASVIGGAPLLVETVSEVFDVEINHYVQLDFLAFKEVVDELGGVPVWFPNPVLDQGTGLYLPDPGCHVLDGNAALAFVRSRRFETMIDGEWVIDGSGDAGRIERQQNFVVLALERAVERGARNPTTLSALISAGADSVVLDQELAPAELIALAEPFTDFDPDSLVRLSPQVYAEQGLPRVGDVVHLVEGVNEDMFDIFRGRVGSARASDIALTVVAADGAVASEQATLLGEVDFVVQGNRAAMYDGAGSVVVYPPDGRDAAVLVARHVIPTPALVEDPTATEITLALGTDHQEISVFFAADESETLAAIDELGDVALPNLTPTTTLAPATTVSVDTTTTAREAATTTTTTTTSTPTTTTTTVAAAPASTTTTEPAVIGRAPEGQHCA